MTDLPSTHDRRLRRFSDTIGTKKPIITGFVVSAAECAHASEKILARDWDTKEEDEAWSSL